MNIVEVVIDGQLAYRVPALHPAVGEVSLPTSDAPPWGDVRDGVPTTIDCIWITEFTGGSGGFSTTFLFELGVDGQLLPVATLSNGVFSSGRWLQPDWTYRYWLTSGAGSPSPVLAGIPGHDGIRWLDPRPIDALTPEKLRELIESIKGAQSSAPSADSSIGPALHGFLNLVYSGRAPDAWRFLDECFDAGLERFLASDAVADLPRSREAFRGALLEKLRESPYHPQLLRFNGGALGPPEE